MNKTKYKIILFNRSKSSMMEVALSKYFILASISILTLTNLVVLHFFSSSYSSWHSNQQIKNHQKHNNVLIEKIESGEDRITSIEDKIDAIVEQDNNMRALLSLPKIHDDVRKLGTGGDDSAKSLTMRELEYLLPDESEIDLQDYFNKLDFIERSTNLELLSYIEMMSNAKKNKSTLRHYPAIYPVDLSEAKLVSKFGYRIDPFSKRYKKHEGHDFSAKVGTDVFATADGVVISSKYNGSFGNFIEISHGNGYKTIYGHLYKRHVKQGSYIKRGDKIGEVGNTGRSTAPHLHYEIKHNNKRVDPNEFYFDNL